MTACFRAESTEREVIILRFGLETGHPLTLEEVGKRFKRDRERIRQIETAALRKLRNPSKSKKIRDFLPVKKGYKCKR